MVEPVDTNNKINNAVQPIEVEAAIAPTAVAVAPTSLMLMAFEIYKLAAVLGLQISRNERASADDNKKMIKHWNKIGVDNTKGQGTAGLLVAVAGLAVAGYALTYDANNSDRRLVTKASDLTPQILGMWTQSYSAAVQEANGKSSLIQTDLTNPARGADSFRSNVEEASKNVCQNVFQLVAQSARGG